MYRRRRSSSHFAIPQLSQASVCIVQSSRLPSVDPADRSGNSSRRRDTYSVTTILATRVTIGLMGVTGTPTTSDREAVLRWVKDHVGERAIELDWPETGADGAGAQMQVSELEIDVALHGYFGGVTPRRLYTFRSDSEAERAVDRVVNATGLRRNFDVRAGGVDNAAAAIRNGRRLLLYNPAFMEEVERQTGSRWAGISVMAHEVGITCRDIRSPVVAVILLSNWKRTNSPDSCCKDWEHHCRMLKQS